MAVILRLGVRKSQALSELPRGIRSPTAKGEGWELNLVKWTQARSSSCICFVRLNSKHSLASVFSSAK